MGANSSTTSLFGIMNMTEWRKKRAGRELLDEKEKGQCKSSALDGIDFDENDGKAFCFKLVAKQEAQRQGNESPQV